MKITPQTLLSAAALILTSTLHAQSFPANINRDSLLQAILKSMPEAKRADFQSKYDSMGDQGKDLLLFVFSMPRSSKKEMIANLDSNRSNINSLNTGFSKLVPKGYEVAIEFNPADKLLSTPESIDLEIIHHIGGKNTYEKEWDLDYGSEKLAKMIHPLGWTAETLQKIKALLKKAKCISIENGDITTIGFGRNAMGKYSFKLFQAPLTKAQITKYNDGCTYIFYKSNIVLEYGGGAIGSQCFPEEN